jgi:hypothetical protein
MVDVQQITVQAEVGITASLDSSVGGLAGGCARREIELCVYGKGWKGDPRDALGSEFLGVYDDNFLNVWVRGLLPVGSERSHCDSFGRKVELNS